MASSPRLPAELTDYTVDFLHDDHHALRALALTAHATLNSARYHLFYAVALHSAHDLSKFSALVTQNPHITPYIQSLTLSKAASTPATTQVSTVDTASAWETTLADSQLPAHLPALKELHLAHFLSFWQPTSFSILSYACFTTVRTLRVSDSSLRSFTELRFLLAALPDVRALVLDAVGIGMKPEDLTWLSSGGEEKDEQERRQLIDGTMTPPSLRSRARALPLFKDPVALSSLHVASRPSSAEAFSPSLSKDALGVLLGYLLATPSVFALSAGEVKLDGFEGQGEEVAGMVKGFRDALVKARREREDWV
ncbi:hypothetical protein EUX98_g8265 [Antrodiella citrinella]|uniref:F-box domain-containing protein n=1 Tax=Antrodiella citrinella TaxID=2447956 RepID=A0A4S4M8Z6_9APHY|nr:hypothetical protein EUX98_g8265 [Antrodiella citrinella]